jgi:hypothetical protein
LKIKWTRGTKSSKRYQAVRAIARPIESNVGRSGNGLCRHDYDGITRRTEAQQRADTDSTMINNRRMACYSNDPALFIGNLTPELKIRKKLHGSRTTSIMTATTIRWEWMDQDGLVHAFDIPDSFSYLNEKVAHQKTTAWRAWETTDGYIPLWQCLHDA